MSFLSPLFLSLLALSALIIALHMRRRRTVTVSSVQIFRRLRGSETRSLRRPVLPRPNLLMVLQLATLTAIVAALSQPLLSNMGRVDHLIVLIDGSDQMQLPVEGETPFERARQQTIDLLSSGAGAGRISILRVDARPSVVIARQDARDTALAESVAEIEPGGGWPDWLATTRYIDRLAHEGEAVRVIVHSSVPPPGLIANVLPGAIIEHRPADGSLSDVTFSATMIEQGDGWQVAGSAEFSGSAEAARMEVRFTPSGNNTPLVIAVQDIARTEAEDETGGQRPVGFSIDIELPGTGIVELAARGDGLRHERKTWFEILGEDQHFDVLYIGTGDQPFVPALQSVPGVRVFQAVSLPVDIAQFGLVVIDDVAVSRVPETSTLWIAGGRVEGMEEPGSASLAQPDYWQSSHPLMRNIAWTNLALAETATIAAPDSADILLSSGNKPLIAAGTGPHGRHIWLAFDPAVSNWPAQPGLPVFASNLVDWLGARPEAGRIGQRCALGQECVVDARFVGGTITLVATELSADDSAPLSDRGRIIPIAGGVIEPDQAGLYRLEYGDRSQFLVVSTSQPVLSDTATAAVAVAPDPGFFVSAWPWLAAIALITLIVEGVVAGRGAERFLHRSALASSNPLSSRRRWLLGLRALTIFCVAFAIFNLPLPWPSMTSQVVMVFSPPSGSELGTGSPGFERAVVEAGAPMADRRLGAVVRTAEADALTGLGEPTGEAGISSLLSADIAESFELALAAIPRSQPGRILLADEGGLTGHDVEALARRMAGRDVILDLIIPRSPPSDDIIVQDLATPLPVLAGDTLPLATRIFAQTETVAELTVKYDGQVVEQGRIDLAAGHNRIDTVIRDIGAEPAMLEVNVEGANDVLSGNNSGGLWVNPREPGRIAILTHQATQGASLARLFEEEGFSAEVMRPDFAPFQLRNWLDYQLVVLLNVASSELERRQQDFIETIVADHGVGLLILGGENAFGPGGYLETPLEQLSPLSSRIPREAPEAALVFVLDRSGSMQQRVGNTTRLDIAKRATLAAIEQLNEQSRVGIVAFDAEAEVVLNLQQVGDGSAVAEALERFDAGGGTSIYPGLVLARDLLAGDEASIRHVVVMTDGMSQPGDFEGVLSDLTDSGTSVSAVAISVGAGSGRDTVRTIATLGGGSYHASDDFEALPSILVQEAMLLSGSPLQEGSSTPRWTGTRPAFLTGLPDEIPAIEGFVLTSPRPGATIAIVTPDTDAVDMPLLASWQYGNGRVLALTTSPTGEWTRDWQAAPDYSQLWSQIARYFLAQSAPGLDLVAIRDADQIRVYLEASGKSAEPITALRPIAVVDGLADDFSMSVALSEVSPGQYEGRFAPLRPGDYEISLSLPDIGDARTRIHIAHAQRFNYTPSTPALARLVEQTGGRLLSDDDPIFPSATVRWTMAGGWPIWLAAALALFMSDLVTRYASPSGGLKRAFGRLLGRRMTRENR